jgi:hypothetical protein
MLPSRGCARWRIRQPRGKRPKCPLSLKDVSVQIRPPDATLNPGLPQGLKDEPIRHNVASIETSVVMREEIVTAVRFNLIPRHEVVVRLTFAVGEGPRPDIVRWFLQRQGAQKTQDGRSLICLDGCKPGRSK